MKTVRGLCGLCASGCGVLISLENDRIKRITPDKTHPTGTCCARGAHVPDVVYSPDRLLYPLKRKGERGAGSFERIGWDEALDSIAENLKSVAARFGPESVCMYTGTGTFEPSLWEQLSPAGTRETSAWDLLFPFGSPNTTGAGSICYASHGIIAPVTTFGVYEIDTFADIDQSDLIVVWGDNPTADSPPVNMKKIARARRKGARVIVIDPRRTDTARVTGAKWIGIRPGTDGALALGMLRVIIEENLYDRKFVEKWTVGFDDLVRYIDAFSPERVEQITSVPAEDVLKTARAIAQAKGASMLSYSGLEYSNSGTQAIRGTLILWALTGNLDVPGGKVIKGVEDVFRVNRKRRLKPPAGIDPVGKDRYPLYHLYRKEAHAMELPRAILQSDPYPIRAILVAGASILTAYPDPDLWRRCFRSLDFMAVADRFMTGDAHYADIVLPATTHFEWESYMIYDRFVRLRERVIEPLGEARSDWQIVHGIAERLGYGHLYPGTEREMIEWALDGTELDIETLRRHPEGIQLAEPKQQYRKWELGLLREDGKPGFETPSGNFEIASKTLERQGYDPLPVYKEPEEGPVSTPELAKEFPLVFNSGARNRFFYNSRYHNIPSLVKRFPLPTVTMNTKDAEVREIRDGDEVWIVSPRGRVRYVAEVTEDIFAGAIEASGHGGSPIASREWRECNMNRLTDHNNRDPLSGLPVYKALLCNVIKTNDTD